MLDIPVDLSQSSVERSIDIEESPEKAAGKMPEAASQSNRS
jgi:hypothetical protein